MQLILSYQQQMISMLQLGVRLLEAVKQLFHNFQRPVASMLTKTHIHRLQLAVMQALPQEHTMQRLYNFICDKTI